MKIIEIIINRLSLSFIFLGKTNNIYTTIYILKMVIIPKALNMANIITTQNRTISKEVVLHRYNIHNILYNKNNKTLGGVYK